MYQKGIIPLVLKLRDEYLEEVTDGALSLTNCVTTTGVSEGGIPAIATGSALHELGFNVVTNSGGTGINHKHKYGLSKIYCKYEVA